MITKTQAYTASDGSMHATLADAQRASLTAVFADMEQTPGQAAAIAARIMDNIAVVRDILTTTPKSRPAARKVNGAKRKPHVAATAANAA